MIKKPNLIFDAGGVLVFPDFNLLANIANQVGIETSSQDIAIQHAQLFRAIDEHIANKRQIPHIHYFLDLFNRVTRSEKKAKAALELTLEADKENSVWATTQPRVSEALQKLAKQGFQMAVVSNSDGRVDQILHNLGLRDYFYTVIDSFEVGVEKPDPRIFEIALESLGWNRTETIYMGDIYFIDIWGANQAGLGAIHLDKMGLYNDWAGIHIPDILELPNLLTKMDGDVRKWDLFPTQNVKVTARPHPEN